MKKFIYYAKNELKKTPLMKARRFWVEHFQRPNITQAWIPPVSSALKKTLLICVESSFDQNVRNAGYLTPLGFAQGWSEVAGGAKFVFAKDLLREIDLHDNSAIFISQHSLRHFTFQEARALRGKDMFVWVHVHPRAFGKFEEANPLIPKEESDLYLDAYAKLMCAEPKFVWNCIGSAGMDLYQGWKDDGFHWETIFPGANNKLYYPDFSDVYKEIKISYVGGYWAEKAQAFDAYLRPWENDFVPFGYGPWPYKKYAGGLSEVQERQLYSSAGLIPLVTSPAGWQMAEITERYLKAPACRAFCITDENPAVRELFSENEMLQAQSSEHFQYMVNEFMSGKMDVEHWKEVGYQATVKKHLVKHRAMQILRALEA